MIEYRNFCKRFRDIVAVRELDLHVRQGETLALIGPNGSGKTTTLKAAVGLVRPTSGNILIDGIDVAIDGRGARNRIGYLPQKLFFAPNFTARELLAMHAQLRGADINSIARSLERVGLQDDADRAVGEFSGGMSQRLGIAIALLGAPRTLIMDEPTAALDPTGAMSVREIISRIAADGTTVLLSSHDLAEVEALASRVAVFVNGHLAALGNISDLAREYSATAERSQAPTDLPGILSLATRQQGTGAEWNRAGNLEQIYRRITDGWRAA